MKNSDVALEIRAAVQALPTRRVPAVRALRREYTRRLKAAPGRAVVQIALKLMDGAGLTERFMAYAGQVPDALIARWARSRDRWWRRAALVSTVPLNLPARGARAEQGDAPRSLAVCELLVADRDDMVVKALSWALRELARRDPQAVRAFVQAHGPDLAARVRREVDNKLRTGLKNPRQRKSAG